MNRRVQVASSEEYAKGEEQSGVDLGQLALLAASVLGGWTVWAVWLREVLLAHVPTIDVSSGVVARTVFWLLPCAIYLKRHWGTQPLRPLGLGFPLGLPQVVRALLLTSLVSTLLFFGTAAQFGVAPQILAERIIAGPHPGWDAPLFEEVVFRGVFLSELLNWTHRSSADLGQLRRRYWCVQITTALLFVLVHWPYWWSHEGLTVAISLSPTIFVTGLILGFVFAHTRSLWACIALHWLNNQLSVAAGF